MVDARVTARNLAPVVFFCKAGVQALKTRDKETMCACREVGRMHGHLPPGNAGPSWGNEGSGPPGGPSDRPLDLTHLPRSIDVR